MRGSVCLCVCVNTSRLEHLVFHNYNPFLGREATKGVEYTPAPSPRLNSALILFQFDAFFVLFFPPKSIQISHLSFLFFLSLSRPLLSLRHHPVGFLLAVALTSTQKTTGNQAIDQTTSICIRLSQRRLILRFSYLEPSYHQSSYFSIGYLRTTSCTSRVLTRNRVCDSFG